MLSVVIAECHYAECHYTECHYAECRYAECRGADWDRMKELNERGRGKNLKSFCWKIRREREKI